MFGATKRMLALVCAAAILSGVGSRVWGQGGGPQGAPPAPGKWGRLASLPQKSEEFSFGDVNGKIYLFGGLPTAGKGPLGLTQEYDPGANKWAMKKNMPLATHHAAVAAYNGKLYLFGGQAQVEAEGSSAMPIANSWEYDPASDTWKALAPMPTVRTAAAAAAVGGKIYVLGGAGMHPGQKVAPLTATTPHRSLDTNEVYDVATNKWETRLTMPTARNHAAIGVVNGKIYVIGGRVGSAVITTSSNTNVVEVYDPAADTWGAAGLRMPTTRSGMGWATYQSKIYITGGQAYDAHVLAVMRNTEIYDPATNSWDALPTMPTARHGVSVAIIGNHLYAIGGHIQAAGTGSEAGNSDFNEVYTFPN